MFICLCFLLISASVFTTLFQGAAAHKYGTLLISMQTLFDVMLANYEPVTFETHNTTHQYALMVHLVISNVFLLNFLIAILSSVYEVMREVGDYAYKAN
jgi:uncharacterized membrane protein